MWVMFSEQVYEGYPAVIILIECKGVISSRRVASENFRFLLTVPGNWLLRFTRTVSWSRALCCVEDYLDSNSLLANDPMATEFINHAHFPLSPLFPLLHIMLLWKSCTLTGYIILSFYSFPFTRHNFLCCHVVLIILCRSLWWLTSWHCGVMHEVTHSFLPACLLVCLYDITRHSFFVVHRHRLPPLTPYLISPHDLISWITYSVTSSSVSPVFLNLTFSWLQSLLQITSPLPSPHTDKPSPSVPVPLASLFPQVTSLARRHFLP